MGKDNFQFDLKPRQKKAGEGEEKFMFTPPRSVKLVEWGEIPKRLRVHVSCMHSLSFFLYPRSTLMGKQTAFLQLGGNALAPE